MRTWAVFNQKGGSAKTSTAADLAASLREKRKHGQVAQGEAVALAVSSAAFTRGAAVLGSTLLVWLEPGPLPGGEDESGVEAAGSNQAAKLESGK